MIPNRYPDNAELARDRLHMNARKFFSAWAQKHAREIENTGFLDEHPAQDIDVVKTEALIPDPSEGPEDLAHRIRQMVGMSFEGNTELAADFFRALDAPYPLEGGNGRTYLEVLDQDYLSQEKGVSVVLGHLDNGLTDVPRATGLLRARLLEAYDNEYIHEVGEEASNTVTYETETTVNDLAVADAIDLLGNTYYVAPDTDSIDEILSLSGLRLEDYEEIQEYINGKAARVIARDLHDGHIIVFSPTGKRAKLIPAVNGTSAQLVMDSVSLNSARLICNAEAIWSFAIVQDRIELGPIIPVDKDFGKELTRDDRHKKLLLQVDTSMEHVAHLANKIFESTSSKVVASYRPSANHVPVEV